MKIFVVLSQSSTAATTLDEFVRTQFAEDAYKLKGDAWLVAGQGTAKEVSERLQITSDKDPDPTNLVAIVFPIDGYYGRADPAVWQWIQSRLARKVDGKQ